MRQSDITTCRESIFSLDDYIVLGAAYRGFPHDSCINILICNTLYLTYGRTNFIVKLYSHSNLVVVAILLISTVIP